MDIEEIQATWAELSNQLEQQKQLTTEIIMNMTQERYTNKFKTITIYETAGTIFCILVALFILFNFKKLDTWYMQASGIITLSFILLLPYFNLKLLSQIRNFNIIDKNYKQALIGFQKAKKNLIRLQRFAIYASYIIMFTTSVVFAKLFGDKDFIMIERKPEVYFVFAFAIAFVFFFTRWGLRSYMKITSSAESVIKELE